MSGDAPFERRQVCFQRRSSGILGTSVVVAVLRLGRVLLDVGRGEVDRRHHSAGGGVGGLPGVDCACAELHV